MSSILWNKKRGSTLLKKLGWHAEAAMLRLFWWCMGRLSPERASATGDWLLRRLGRRSDKFRKVRANLAMAFPEKNAVEIEELASGVMGSLGAVLAEFAHLDAFTDRRRPDPLVEIVNLCDDTELVADRKPCIFFSAHLANWELVPYAAVVTGYKGDVLYTPLSNPLLDRLLQDKRRQLGSTHLPRNKALRQLLKSLRRGRSVGMLVDVRIDDTNLLPFFGTGAGLTTAPAWLSMKTGHDLMPMFCERTGHARYRVTIYPALPRPPADLAEADAVRWLAMEMISVLEARIRAHPDQWMCTNRRWPKQVMRDRGVY